MNYEMAKKYIQFINRENKNLMSTILDCVDDVQKKLLTRRVQSNNQKLQVLKFINDEIFGMMVDELEQGALLINVVETEIKVYEKFFREIFTNIGISTVELVKIDGDIGKKIPSDILRKIFKRHKDENYAVIFDA